MKRIIITVEEIKPGQLAVDSQPEDGAGTPLEMKLAQRINNRIAANLERFVQDAEFGYDGGAYTETDSGADVIKAFKEGRRKT